MKIKNFLALMLASAAAMVSLTACSGGAGDENESDAPGYLSTRKFAGGAVVIRSFNSVGLEIAPDRKMNTKKLPGTVIVPGETVDDDDIEYDVKSAVRCEGYIGAVGGTRYRTQFIYSVTDNDKGIVQTMFTDVGKIDDEGFIAACGFAVDNEDADVDNGGTTYERATLASMNANNLQIVLDFNTQMMEVITSGSGFMVDIKDAEGNVVDTKPCTSPIRINNTTVPYFVDVD